MNSNTNSIIYNQTSLNNNTEEKIIDMNYNNNKLLKSPIKCVIDNNNNIDYLKYYNNYNIKKVEEYNKEYEDCNKDKQQKVAITDKEISECGSSKEHNNNNIDLVTYIMNNGSSKNSDYSSLNSNSNNDNYNYLSNNNYYSYVQDLLLEYSLDGESYVEERNFNNQLGEAFELLNYSIFNIKDKITTNKIDLDKVRDDFNTDIMNKVNKITTELESININKSLITDCIGVKSNESFLVKFIFNNNLNNIITINSDLLLKYPTSKLYKLVFLGYYNNKVKMLSINNIEKFNKCNNINDINKENNNENKTDKYNILNNKEKLPVNNYINNNKQINSNCFNSTLASVNTSNNLSKISYNNTNKNQTKQLNVKNTNIVNNKNKIDNSLTSNNIINVNNNTTNNNLISSCINNTTNIISDPITLPTTNNITDEINKTNNNTISNNQKINIYRDYTIFNLLIYYIRNNENLPFFDNKEQEALFYQELDYWNIPLKHNLSNDKLFSFDSDWCASTLLLNKNCNKIEKHDGQHGIVFLKQQLNAYMNYIEFKVNIRVPSSGTSHLFIGLIDKKFHKKEYLSKFYL